MQRFRYLHGDSFFHRMDPTWKLLWNFVVVGAVLFNFDPVYIASWFVYVLVLALLLARIPPRQYARSMVFFVAIGLFIMIWHAIYSPWSGEVLLAWGPLRTTREGLLEGLGLFFRILVISSVTMIFTLTTDPARLVESLIQVAHVPYRIGYTMYAALRFIPLYENEAQVIMNAHQIRGVGGTRGPLERLKLVISLTVPLLVSGIRRARAAAIAMDSRGFGAYDRRTNLRVVRVPPSSIAFFGAHVVLAAAAFVYYVVLQRGTGYLG